MRAILMKSQTPLQAAFKPVLPVPLEVKSSFYLAAKFERIPFCILLKFKLGRCSPQPRHRELAAERPEAPAPAPVPDAVEEEVDYEADEVDDVAAAPEEPTPHEARRPRANSESKSAAEVQACAFCPFQQLPVHLGDKLYYCLHA